MTGLLKFGCSQHQQQQNRKTKTMAQKAIQSDKYNFTVEAAPSFMQLADGTFVKDGFTVNRRTDNMAVLGKVTDRYGIVQNTDLVSAAEEAFGKEKLADFKRTMVVTGEGEKMYATYDFRSRTRKLKVGDEVGLRLTLQNSFDGSLRASFLGGTLRLRCSNGMVAIEREVGLTRKHGMSISVKFVHDALLKAIASWDKSIMVFDRLADVAVTQEQGHTILNRLADLSILSNKLREGIAGIWTTPTYTEDSSRNLWNLYNAVTQHLTHEVSGERFELANRTSSAILSMFERASRDNNRFAKLVAPMPAPVVVS